jgi:hypothetical protein
MDDRVIRLSEHDRLLAEYEGLPDALKTGTSTIRAVPFIPTHPTSLWVVQTLRVKDRGDFAFITRVSDPDGALQLVLPPQVTEVLARQRDQLTTRSRSKAAKSRAHLFDASHLQDPAVRAKALAARKAKAATRRARRARR